MPPVLVLALASVSPGRKGSRAMLWKGLTAKAVDSALMLEPLWGPWRLWAWASTCTNPTLLAVDELPLPVGLPSDWFSCFPCPGKLGRGGRPGALLFC